MCKISDLYVELDRIAIERSKLYEDFYPDSNSLLLLTAKETYVMAKLGELAYNGGLDE